MGRIEQIAAVELEREEGRRSGVIPRANSVRMSDVQPQQIKWLWRSRIACGKLTLIAGDPGLGKSMLTASLAAHVTTGRKWPDGAECPKGSVIFVSGEDDPGDTIRPRLDMAGADVNRVHLLESVHDAGKARGFNLGDVVPLAGLLDEIDDCLLVVIDPISAYLAGTDSHKNADIRALLTPLAQMAAGRGVSITAVSHLNKSQAGNALGRVTGSLAFVAAARAAYIVARDPQEQTKRLLLPIKNNLGNDRTGLSYRIAEENGIPYVVWDREPVTISADEALAPVVESESQRASRGDAAEFLANMLKDLPAKVDDIKREAKDAGISWATVRRAKELIGAKSKKSGFDKGSWVWFLPPNAKMLSRTDIHLSTFGGVEHLRENDDVEDAQVVEDAQSSHGVGEHVRDDVEAYRRASGGE
jgi:hypothetical protein